MPQLPHGHQPQLKAHVPNFAYLMVADAYDAVSALPGVRSTQMVLEDHFASDAINGGVAARAGFVRSFDGEAVAELDQLRADFVRKAVMAGTARDRENQFWPRTRTLRNAGPGPGNPGSWVTLPRRSFNKATFAAQNIRGDIMTDGRHAIRFTYLSQEDLLEAGCLDFQLAIDAAESALLAHRNGDVLFPEKIVQIFNDDTQERINCLPATLWTEKICGMKWVSVFPPNVPTFGLQSLTALFVLSEIEKGFPFAVMEGTLASNLRVGAMAALAARHFAPERARMIGFIGSGEQAKMHLLAMKTVRPSLVECRVAAKTAEEEQQFVRELAPILPDMTLIAAETDGARAMKEADILVTATSAQAPLLKASWMKRGSFYSHVGGWEDEYAVAKQCDKIVCDDWETVKHRTQTLSRMYKDGELSDADIAGQLVEYVAGDKPGRERDDERVYFNAVGLAFVDVAIALAMYRRAVGAGKGRQLTMQETTIFGHPHMVDYVRLGRAIDADSDQAPRQTPN
jgi:N-[(2S)-2-amino-2-carboxyethyl]-L-glutamate dehydrogenase